MNRFAKMMPFPRMGQVQYPLPLMTFIQPRPIEGTATNQKELEDKLTKHIETKIASLKATLTPVSSTLINMEDLKKSLISDIKGELEKFIIEKCELKDAVTRTKDDLNNLLMSKLKEELDKLTFTPTIATLRTQIDEIDAKSNTQEAKIQKLEKLEKRIDDLIKNNIRTITETVEKITKTIPDINLITNTVDAIKGTVTTLESKIKKLDDLERTISLVKSELTDMINRNIANLNKTIKEKDDLKITEYNLAFENIYSEISKLTKMITNNTGKVTDYPIIMAYIEEVKDSLNKSFQDQFKQLFETKYREKLTEFSQMVSTITDRKIDITKYNQLVDNFKKFKDNFNLEIFTQRLKDFKDEIDRINREILTRLATHVTTNDMNMKLEELRKLFENDDLFNDKLNRRKSELLKEIREEIMKDVNSRLNENNRLNDVKITELTTRLQDLITLSTTNLTTMGKLNNMISQLKQDLSLRPTNEVTDEIKARILMLNTMITNLEQTELPKIRTDMLVEIQQIKQTIPQDLAGTINKLERDVRNTTTISEMKGIRSELNDIRQKYTSINTRVDENNVRHTRSIENINKRINDEQQYRVNMKTELDQIKAKFEGLPNTIIRDLDTNIKSIEMKLNTMASKTELDNVQKNINKLKDELSTRIEQYRGEMTRRIAELQDKVSTLIDRDYFNTELDKLRGLLNTLTPDKIVGLEDKLNQIKDDVKQAFSNELRTIKDELSTQLKEIIDYIPKSLVDKIQNDIKLSAKKEDLLEINQQLQNIRDRLTSQQKQISDEQLNRANERKAINATLESHGQQIKADRIRLGKEEETRAANDTRINNRIQDMLDANKQIKDAQEKLAKLNDTQYRGEISALKETLRILNTSLSNDYIAKPFFENSLRSITDQISNLERLTTSNSLSAETMNMIRNIPSELNSIRRDVLENTKSITQNIDFTTDTLNKHKEVLLYTIDKHIEKLEKLKMDITNRITEEFTAEIARVREDYDKITTPMDRQNRHYQYEQLMVTIKDLEARMETQIRESTSKLIKEIERLNKFKIDINNYTPPSIPSSASRTPGMGGPPPPPSMGGPPPPPPPGMGGPPPPPPPGMGGPPPPPPPPPGMGGPPGMGPGGKPKKTEDEIREEQRKRRITQINTELNSIQQELIPITQSLIQDKTNERNREKKQQLDEKVQKLQSELKLLTPISNEISEATKRDTIAGGDVYLNRYVNESEFIKNGSKINPLFHIMKEGDYAIVNPKVVKIISTYMTSTKNINLRQSFKSFTDNFFKASLADNVYKELYLSICISILINKLLSHVINVPIKWTKRYEKTIIDKIVRDLSNKYRMSSDMKYNFTKLLEIDFVGSNVNVFKNRANEIIGNVNDEFYSFLVHLLVYDFDYEKDITPEDIQNIITALGSRKLSIKDSTLFDKNKNNNLIQMKYMLQTA